MNVLCNIAKEKSFFMSKAKLPVKLNVPIGLKQDLHKCRYCFFRADKRLGNVLQTRVSFVSAEKIQLELFSASTNRTKN